MNTFRTGLSVAIVLFAANSALADDQNPDAKAPTMKPAHTFLAIGAGPSFSSVDAGSVHYLSFHAHLDVNVGREVLVFPIGTDRGSIAIGYTGGADANADELLQHHGFGITVRKSWISLTLDGGVSFVQGFTDGTFGVGGHFGVQPAFRIGPVQLGLPVSVDVFNLAVSTFGATLGVQL